MVNVTFYFISYEGQMSGYLLVEVNGVQLG